MQWRLALTSIGHVTQNWPALRVSRSKSPKHQNKPKPGEVGSGANEFFVDDGDESHDDSHDD